MKIYHYTKGFCLNSIFEDGFIATEMKRGLNRVNHITNNVWLTEKTTFPKTALPFISCMPETSLAMHLQTPNMYVDLNKLGSFTGGIWRFVFDSDDIRFKKWWFCEQRKTLANNLQWVRMENVANKVGDEIRKFWICETDLLLESFTLQVFENGVWVDKLSNCSLISLNNNDRATLVEIKKASNQKCIELGFTVDAFKKAA